MRILFVEDDPIIALSADQTLTCAGHDVIGPFHNAEDALAGASGARADMAVVDINLSGHNEGLDVARQLRKRHGLRSVFATGQADVARDNQDAALGVLQKPYSDTALRELIAVVAIILKGGPRPTSIPAGLELFSA
ncbi:MAG: response regulator [Vitreimonas sp.]